MTDFCFILSCTQDKLFHGPTKVSQPSSFTFDELVEICDGSTDLAPKQVIDQLVPLGFRIVSTIVVPGNPPEIVWTLVK
ncbi:hypothetical protein L596_028556 [Steinernema carpocapsae]|uniref:GTP cyclohydrolase 1 feedback regulatory protein n=1 Tax=Steinernema carpocapsae TaxID=34508 RepID=A0A4U5LYS5_STECR|nr:hypothetical protein L596_028556 [Steinernema carpocapsae]